MPNKFDPSWSKERTKLEAEKWIDYQISWFKCYTGFDFRKDRKLFKVIGWCSRCKTPKYEEIYAVGWDGADSIGSGCYRCF